MLIKVFSKTEKNLKFMKELFSKKYKKRNIEKRRRKKKRSIFNTS